MFLSDILLRRYIIIVAQGDRSGTAVSAPRCMDGRIGSGLNVGGDNRNRIVVYSRHLEAVRLTLFIEQLNHRV